MDESYDNFRKTMSDISDTLSTNKDRNAITREMIMHIGKDSKLDKDIYGNDP